MTQASDLLLVWLRLWLTSGVLEDWVPLLLEGCACSLVLEGRGAESSELSCDVGFGVPLLGPRLLTKNN